MLLTEKKLSLEKHSLCSKICDYLKNIATNITLVHTKKDPIEGSFGHDTMRGLISLHFRIVLFSKLYQSNAGFETTTLVAISFSPPNAEYPVQNISLVLHQMQNILCTEDSA